MIAALAIILTPCYALWLFHRVSYGLESAFIAKLFQDFLIIMIGFLKYRYLV
jgi:NADH:ubiquinone oxidoreductase subunit 4 (subunit M)